MKTVDIVIMVILGFLIVALAAALWFFYGPKMAGKGRNIQAPHKATGGFLKSVKAKGLQLQQVSTNTMVQFVGKMMQQQQNAARQRAIKGGSPQKKIKSAVSGLADAKANLFLLNWKNNNAQGRELKRLQATIDSLKKDTNPMVETLKGLSGRDRARAYYASKRLPGYQFKDTDTGH